MIKNNDATECGVNNGAEGVVVDWTVKDIENYPGRQSLDILFVKLTSNPNPIQLEGLPLNVVPISHRSEVTSCVVNQNYTVSVSRDQVPVLPNFAMTDFASQGRTREYNVVDIRHSRNHFGVYTSLSRGKSYHGTLILHSIPKGKITGGISGFIREEFRDLEMLDEITTLRYNKQLPSEIQ